MLFTMALCGPAKLEQVCKLTTKILLSWKQLNIYSITIRWKQKMK